MKSSRKNVGSRSNKKNRKCSCSNKKRSWPEFKRRKKRRKDNSSWLWRERLSFSKSSKKPKRRKERKKLQDRL